MDRTLNRTLKDAVEEAAEEYDWTFVDGIAEGFRGHGYCRSRNERYFVTASESCTRQGDFNGIMHPNQSGHRVYRDQIAAAIRREWHGRGGDADDRERSDREPIVRDHRTRDDRPESDRQSRTPPGGGGHRDPGIGDPGGNVHRK